MFSILLVIIYISFISLGLPDPLIGAAWPVMYRDLGVSVSHVGIITMLISGGTIISSLFSDRLTKKFGTGLVTAVSVFMTAAALFGFSLSYSFIFLCVWAIPYGLGAGAVDASLNNYVALHYASRHMSWLHCFWGVGTAISPYIMGYCLTNGKSWNSGYVYVSLLQLALTIILFISLPLWKKRTDESNENVQESEPLTLRKTLSIKGVPLILITFFAYCALEQTTGVWASSYLVNVRNVDAATAAKFASLFYLGITFGRFLSGFVSDKVGDKKLIKMGIFVAMAGIIMVALPLETNYIALFGLVVIGFGCAPIYPSIIHATPTDFGKENSQAIIGVQMASAYVGATFMSPFFGVIISFVNISFYPIYLLFFALLMLFTSEKLKKVLYN